MVKIIKLKSEKIRKKKPKLYFAVATQSKSSLFRSTA